jgi:hypothetical protein
MNSHRCHVYLRDGQVEETKFHDRVVQPVNSGIKPPRAQGWSPSRGLGWLVKSVVSCQLVSGSNPCGLVECGLGGCGLALASESRKINSQPATYPPLSYSDRCSTPKLD